MNLAVTDKGSLFRVSKNAHGPAAIDIEHRGARWSVEEDDPMSATSPAEDRTLQVMALLNELIAAQTSAADFSPSIVRVR